MSLMSNTSLALNLYDEDVNESSTLDLSSQKLDIFPNVDNKSLSVLYLQNNNIASLPDDFFPSFPNLMWLDLRDNRLTEIPKTIKNHQSLTHLLLSNNKISSLPNELGTLKYLKVLQLNGNPLSYPPDDVITAGTVKVLSFLQEKYIDDVFAQSRLNAEESEAWSSGVLEASFSNDARSYNSVLDEEKLKKEKKPLSVQFSEKETDDSDLDYYSKVKGKCPKLPKSRLKTLSPNCQSSKYLKKLLAYNKETQDARIKQSFLKDLALKKHKDLLAATERILQGKKNKELLKNWQQRYRNKQLISSNSTYKSDPKNYPYDTSPEYMTLLSREDIEKDLPDKYRKRLIRRSKPTVPRKNNSDVHLAMKIKQLFDNLEAIDLNRETMTPRTEQKVLLGEIQKISEIKQKLMELSTSNIKSVSAD